MGYFNDLVVYSGFAVAYSFTIGSCFSYFKGILYSFLTADIDLVTVLLNVAFFSLIAFVSFCVTSSTFSTFVSYSFFSMVLVVYFYMCGATLLEP